jgi:prophage DNA circulation protein
MKLPEAFKFWYWLALVVGLSAFVIIRFDALSRGLSTPFDALAFVVLVALLLAPLFGEVSLLGVNFKHELGKLKSEVTEELREIRTELRINTVTQSSAVSNVHVSQMDPTQTADQLRSIVSEALAASTSSVSPRPAADVKMLVPGDVATLFSVRYGIEKEINRLRATHNLERKPLPMTLAIRLLMQAELIDERMARAVRDIYAVCSAAIHGEAVASEKVALVKADGPAIIATLSSIR